MTATLIALVLACSKNPVDPGDDPEPDPVISEAVFSVDSADSVALADIDSTSVTLSYTGSPPDIVVDDIVVGSDGYGYLRRVTAVGSRDSLLVLETTQASLSEAIIEGHFEATVPLEIPSEPDDRGESSLRIAYLAPGVRVWEGCIELEGTEIYRGQVGPDSLVVQIPDGQICFGADLHIDAHLEPGGLIGRLRDFEAIATGTFEFWCDVNARATGGLQFSHDTLLAEFQRVDVQWIGYVPVVEVTRLRFYAGFDAFVSNAVSVQAGFDSAFDVECGARYRLGEGWDGVWAPSFELESRPVEWSHAVECTLRGYVKPSITVDFYAIAGPELELLPHLAFDGGVGDSPLWWWELWAGIDASLGFHVQILDWEVLHYSRDFELWRRLIASNSSADAEGGLILFSSIVEEHNSEIFAMSGDGTGRTRLTYAPTYEAHPSWSPDGSRIAFASGSERWSGDIWIMDSDGSNWEQLSDAPAVEILPDWSPDGSRIAYCRFDAGHCSSCASIYVMNADGTGVELVVESDGTRGFLSPQWSPDGTRITYWSHPDEPWSEEEWVHILSLDDGSVLDVCIGVLPSWSPDGERITYATGEASWYEVRIRDVATGAETYVGEGAVARWSPSGSALVFYRPCRVPGPVDIWTLALPGGPANQLTDCDVIIDDGDFALDWAAAW